MHAAKAGESPDRLLAQALVANLGVMVEGLDLEGNYGGNLVDEALWNSPVPKDMVPYPEPCLIF